MSRCFPFPPPGYEKKPRSDHESLLIKEKNKEKKHKKEKRDKEKKQGKERKDRDKDKHRSKDKHREKKDKKDKHKDKDKKKHKDKKKILSEKKGEEHREGHNGSRPGEGSCEAEYLKVSKFSVDLDGRIRDGEIGADNQTGEKITGTVQRASGSVGSSAEKKSSGRKMGTGNKMRQSITIPDQRMAMASTMEKTGTEGELPNNSLCEERGRVNKMVTGNKMPQSITICDQRMAMVSTMETKGTEGEMLQNSICEDRGRVNKMVSGNKMLQSITIPDQRIAMASTMEKRGTEGEMLQNSICEERRRVNGMGRPMGQDVHKKIEEKNTTKEQEVDGLKDRIREKVHKGKNRERDKEKKKEKEKTREEGEHKHKEQDKVRGILKREQEDSLDDKCSLIPRNNQKSACPDVSLKRKQINGFLHENEMRCSKLSRPASSTKLPLENGSKLDQSLIASPRVSESHEAVNIVKVERILHGEKKVNGITDIQLPSSTVLGPPSVLDTTEDGDSFKRPPHPDEKYVSQILHIPKMEEWPEFDDQDWLFSRDNTQQKPKTLHNADESLQVWANALQIETADVIALPYVIPY